MATANTERDERPGADREPAQHGALARFLNRSRAAVLDVVRGAAPDTRRLLVGSPHSRRVSYVVAAGPTPPAWYGAEAEHETLLSVEGRLRPVVDGTLPRVVDRVQVSATLTGVVLTAVPGLVAGQHEDGSSPRGFLTALESWLPQVWEDTAGPRRPTDLGGLTAQTVLARHAGSARMAPTLGVIHRASQQVAPLEVPATLSHGCLCLRHVRIQAAAVVGVDDWGLGATAGDPLRDLGRAAVHAAGPRLPEVLVGRTSFAGVVRHFLAAGLEVHGAPRQSWRDVLVLTQLELASEAFDRGHPDGLALLAQAVQAWRAER